jgi:REP element-mobilizing transposase RayT
MNRGIAHRPAFEDRKDIRFFLSLLAHRVRAGQIEVHAYAILTTHFHLLVRSPRGELSDALMTIGSSYVRRFNRKTQRDGALFRGRFVSRRIDSEAYWSTLIRYIDHNPIAAGIAPRARDYPYASAWHYHRSRGPIWLARREIEGSVCRARGLARFEPSAYESVYGPAPSHGERWIVEQATNGAGGAAADSVYDDLIAAAPPRVLAWMRAQALLADRGAIGRKLAVPALVIGEIERWRASGNDFRVRSASGRAIVASGPLTAGLLRDACGSTFDEIGARIEASRSKAADRARSHRRLLLSDRDYADAASELLHRALRAGVRTR